MDEKDWLILKTLQDEKNITKTAAVVYISQPAITKRLQQIEERFGVNIAIRGRSGIEMTPAGEYLARCARELLEKLSGMDEYLKNMDDTIRGTLRIGASYFCTKYFLPDILMQFKVLHPLVEFKLLSGWSTDISKMVYSGDLHVAVVRSEKLFPCEKYLLFREKTYACSKNRLSMAELPDAPQIDYKSDTANKVALDSWWAENYTRPPFVTMEVDRVDTCGDMVAKGLGYGFLPEIIVNRMPGVWKQELRHKTGEPYYRHTWLASNPEARQLKVVSCFIDFVENFSFTGELRAVQYTAAES